MASRGRIALRTEGDTLIVAVAGRWCLGEAGSPDGAAVRAIEAGAPRRIGFDATAVEAWDSELVAFAARVVDAARARDVPVDDRGLPDGVRRMLALAAAAPARTPPPSPPRLGVVARIGVTGAARGRLVADVVAFVGEAAVACGRLITGRARVRGRDVALQIQLTGPGALAIVALVSFLVGLIFAFVSAVQLERLGAELYVADLVAIAMVRDMGALTAAIVLAGRTGAAYAAELGAMQTGQEIDALEVLGISPMEFLVVPRLIALVAMLPLLTVFADLLGIIGGALVGIGLMDVPSRIYRQETVEAIQLDHLIGGVFKGAAYGALIAAAGCFEGLRSPRNAAGVGRAVTRAVVDGIVLVIAACGLFAALFYVMGIG